MYMRFKQVDNLKYAQSPCLFGNVLYKITLTVLNHHWCIRLEKLDLNQFLDISIHTTHQIIKETFNFGICFYYKKSATWTWLF